MAGFGGLPAKPLIEETTSCLASWGARLCELLQQGRWKLLYRPVTALGLLESILLRHKQIEF